MMNTTCKNFDLMTAQDVKRYKWLLNNLHLIECQADAAYDIKKEKPAVNFKSITYHAALEHAKYVRQWNTSGDQVAQLLKNLDALIDYTEKHQHLYV